MGGGHWVACVSLPAVGRSQEPRGSLRESPQSSSWWSAQPRGWVRTGLGVARPGSAKGAGGSHQGQGSAARWPRTSQEDPPNTSRGPRACREAALPRGQTVLARGEEWDTQPGFPPPTGPGRPMRPLTGIWVPPLPESPLSQQLHSGPHWGGGQATWRNLTLGHQATPGHAHWPRKAVSGLSWLQSGEPLMLWTLYHQRPQPSLGHLEGQRTGATRPSFILHRVTHGQA